MKLSALTFAAFLALVAAAPAPVRVAALFPVTGPDADFACMVRALPDLAKAAGVPAPTLEIVPNENDVARTKALAEDLAKSGKYDLVLGTRTSQEAIVAADALDAGGVPFVTPLAAHPRITEGKRFVLSLVPTQTTYAKLYGRFVVSDLKAKKLAVVVNLSQPYSEFYGENVAAEAKALDAAVTAKQFQIIDGFRDFDKLAADIKAYGPDLVHVPLYAPQTIQLLGALRKLGFKGDLLSHTSADDGTAILKEIDPSGGTRLFLNGIWDRTFPRELKADFLKLHAARCGAGEPSMRAVAAYDMMRLVVAALKKKPNARGADLVAALKAEKVAGIMGPLHFDGGANAVRGLEMFRIQAARMELHRKIPP